MPSGVLIGPRDEIRLPQLPSPSGLFLLRGTPNEPMSRKVKFLDCVDMLFCSVSSHHKRAVAVPAKLGTMRPEHPICYDRCR